MDAYPASLVPSALGRLERETGMLLATVDSLADDEMRGPSKCPGWTRAHVVTHLARSADALGNLIEWARTGQEKPAYASAEERDRGIEEGAPRPSDEIKADLHAACDRLAEVIGQLAGDLETLEVSLPSGPVPSRAIPTLWMAEVLLHHDDLDTVWEVEEADPDAQLDALEEAVRRLRSKTELPPFTIRTVEKDEWSFGEGGPTVRGERDGMLLWLARGDEDGVRCDGELPEVAAFA